MKSDSVSESESSSSKAGNKATLTEALSAGEWGKNVVAGVLRFRFKRIRKPEGEAFKGEERAVVEALLLRKDLREASLTGVLLFESLLSLRPLDWFGRA